MGPGAGGIVVYGVVIIAGAHAAVLGVKKFEGHHWLHCSTDSTVVVKAGCCGSCSREVVQRSCHAVTK